MTLPTDIIFPFRPEQLTSDDPQKRVEYQRDFVFTLTRMYQDMAQAINGDIRDFTATVLGATTTGTGTYTKQSGTYLRQGLMVDYWFDIEWTAHTGTGNLTIQLPYKVRNVLNQPWIGVVTVDDITFPAGTTYVTIRGINSTYTAEVIASGSAISSANIPIASPGQLRGHIRFLGVEFEEG